MEKDRDRERKSSTASMQAGEPAVAIRSSLQDARGSLQIGYDMDAAEEKQDRETEKLAAGAGGGVRRQASVEESMSSAATRVVEEPIVASKKTTTFAALPNTTTWQKQSEHTQKHDLSGERLVEEEEEISV